MKSRRIETVTQRLTLEVGFAGELGAAGLTEAIIEALEKGGVLEEAGIVYIRAEAPGERLMAIYIWAPEPVAVVEPPMTPEVVEVDQADARRLLVEDAPPPEPNV
jgi:hypothetical protein